MFKLKLINKTNSNKESNNEKSCFNNLVNCSLYNKQKAIIKAINKSFKNKDKVTDFAERELTHDNFEVSLIVPESKGGTYNDENIQILHKQTAKEETFGLKGILFYSEKYKSFINKKVKKNKIKIKEINVNSRD